LFGSLVAFVEEQLLVMICCLHSAYEACEVDDAIVSENAINLLEHTLSEIFEVLNELATPIVAIFDDDANEVINLHLAHRAMESFTEAYDRVRDAVDTSDFHLVSTFFKMIRKNGKITYPVFNIFFHNVNGKRRTLSSFQKTLSSDMFAIIRKLFFYVFLLDFSMPASTLLVREILFNESALPPLSRFKSESSKLFYTDFPGFLKRNYYFIIDFCF